MKVLIAQGRRKRELVGPFGICASRRDFESLRDQINAWLADPGNGCGISYGYLFVQERVVEMGPPNTQPEPWDSEVVCSCGGGHAAYAADASLGAGHAVNCPVRVAHPFKER